MTYIGLMTLLSLVATLRMTWTAIIIGTVTALFYGYALLCVGAMYERFLREHHEKQRAVQQRCDSQVRMDGCARMSDEIVWSVSGESA
jgi:hypothetical protein